MPLKGQRNDEKIYRYTFSNIFSPDRSKLLITETVDTKGLV